MTREEAIWYLQPIADSASLPRYAEALNLAIAALREQEKVAQVEKALTNKMREFESKLRALESNRVESHTVNECEWCAKWKSATCPLESAKGEV